jgi:hypothetical protein
MYREVLTMFDGMSKPTLMMTALIGGLALFVAGFVIALEVRSTSASPAAASTGGACYTNWNGDTCAAGYTAVETGEWTGALFWTEHPSREEAMTGGSVICADKTEDAAGLSFGFIADTANYWSTENEVHSVSHEPCAICCPSGGVVGGIGELPDVAGAGDPLPRNPIIIAAVTAAIAFGAGAWYARRRWVR